MFLFRLLVLGVVLNDASDWIAKYSYLVLLKGKFDIYQIALWDSKEEKLTAC